MSFKKKLYLCLSLDVEEEGLFCGHYETTRPQLKNISLLPELLPVVKEFNINPTLFCAWSVFADKSGRETLEYMQANCGAEIGAHLHHWNTPPLSAEQCEKPARTHLLQRDIFLAKLDTLLDAAKNFLGHPAESFRMGRWDLKAPLLAYLAERGIKADSSICPLRNFAGGANHFMAPVQPWWRPTRAGTILEVPLTQLPLWKGLAKFWNSISVVKPEIQDTFHFFGALSANPFWHNSFVMRQAVKTLLARGGKILNLFWHSSETMPGGSPRTPDEYSARKYWQKIYKFFSWLYSEYDVTSLTIGSLATMNEVFHFPTLEESAERDF